MLVWAWCEICSLPASCLSLVLSFLEGTLQRRTCLWGLSGCLAGYLLKCLVRPVR